MLRFLAGFLASLFLTLTAAQAQENGPADPSGAAADSLQILLDVLQDDAARAALIERLQADAATPLAEATAAADTPAPAAEDISLGRRIALITQDAAENVADWATGFWSQLTRAPAVFDGLSGDELGVLTDALADLALVIAGTVIAFLVLRWLGKTVYARMSASARDGGMARTATLFVTSALLDALIVVLAWALGYALAILALGEFGQIGIRQTLYLNAFLLVEMVKVAVRLVLSPSATGLRPLPIGDRAASYLSSRISLMVGIAGYGQLLVVPIINSNVSFAAGRAVSALVAFAVLGLAIWLVLRNRKTVTDWMLGTPDPDQPAPTGRRQGALAYMARHWHWPVLAYLLVMFAVVLTRPGDTVFRLFFASGQVLVVGLLGFAVSGFLSRAMVHGVVLPQRLSDRVPLLQGRLNAFVPKLLFVLRAVIFVAVILLALNAVGLLDLRAWMISQFGLAVTGAILSVGLILLVSFGIWLALTSWVDYRLNPEYGSVPTAREKTLLTLLRNAATIALIIITMMFVLAEIGLDIAPLLASAGVLGLAIGFGAQKMVQDIITGIFIQFENAMNVGDVVTVGGTTGTVERLTIRSVSLRDVQGVYHIIPFSSVDMVSNYVKDYGYFVCDMGVAYRENVDEVKQAMLDAFEQLKADPDQASGILDELEWFGLNSFGDSAVVLRARIKCVPGRQWGVGRAYNGVLKEVFDARNIEIPFPHQTIFFGESKDGKTQPLKIEKGGEA